MKKLAIEGGEPVRRTPYLSWPYFDDREKEALLRVLESGQWWRMANNEVDLFEQEFSHFHQANFTLAVSNGTHALEVALLAYGIQPGDEVIVPSFTFISTAMAVQRVGAIPIPVDVNLQDYCIDIACVEKAITPYTKAIIPVHMAGHVADMAGLYQLADPYNLIIIQDAAHAHGAIRGGMRLGQWNTTACFSFQNFKLMTAGEGGAILFSDEALKNKAFIIHNCGRPAFDKNYEHQYVGSNYRMNAFSGSILRVQLSRLMEQNQKRNKNGRLLIEILHRIPGVICQSVSKDMDCHPFYMFLIRFNTEVLQGFNRDFLVKALIAEGIPAFINYKSIYKTSAFHQSPSTGKSEKYWESQCPNAEKISTEGIWIHHRALLGDENDTLDIARALQKILRLQHKLEVELWEQS